MFCKIKGHSEGNSMYKLQLMFKAWNVWESTSISWFLNPVYDPKLYHSRFLEIISEYKKQKNRKRGCNLMLEMSNNVGIFNKFVKIGRWVLKNVLLARHFDQVVDEIWRHEIIDIK